MALLVTRAELRANVRRFTDTGGKNAKERHPDADLDEYIDRALGSMHRRLTGPMPEQRILASDTISTVDGTSLYDLPDDFDHLISVDISANGVKSWLLDFKMSERPALSDANASYTGRPVGYRLAGSTSGGTQIELLPVPTAIYTLTLWYVPSAKQFTSDTQTYDSISRLDDYLIAYASRYVAVKDKNSELLGMCREILQEIGEAIETAASSRDKNSPARITDELLVRRNGRRRIGWRR